MDANEKTTSLAEDEFDFDAAGEGWVVPVLPWPRSGLSYGHDTT
jgi:hypothetical protein